MHYSLPVPAIDLQPLSPFSAAPAAVSPGMHIPAGLLNLQMAVCCKVDALTSYTRAGLLRYCSYCRLGSACPHCVHIVPSACFRRPQEAPVRASFKSAIRMYKPFFAWRKYAARGSLSTSGLICGAEDGITQLQRPVWKVQRTFVG